MNNKGITLIEIIISIVLISIVLIFLFSLLITVNDINYESEVNSTYLINKSLILKNIEEDFDNAKNITLSECSIPSGKTYPVQELYSTYPSDLSDTNYFHKSGVDINDLIANKCIKFTYEWEDPTDTSSNMGLLGIYYYKNKGDYVISYIRDNIKATRILPDFEKVDKNLEMEWTYNGSTTIPVAPNNELKNFYNIHIPIIGYPDGKDYSLNISYYKKP